MRQRVVRCRECGLPVQHIMGVLPEGYVCPNCNYILNNRGQRVAYFSYYLGDDAD
jgi:hypothetical protein